MLGTEVVVNGVVVVVVVFGNDAYTAAAAIIITTITITAITVVEIARAFFLEGIIDNCPRRGLFIL